MPFLARHFLATFVTIIVPCLFWTLAYFGLLLWGVIIGGGIGSPATYPVGMVLLVALGIVASLVLFLPSTMIAERLVRARRLPGWAQIPISIATLAVLCLAATLIASAFGLAGKPMRAAGTVFLASLVPMGLYWWTAQSGPIVISFLRRLHLIRK